MRTWLRQRKIRHTIPERSDQIRKRLRRGRIIPDQFASRQRHDGRAGHGPSPSPAMHTFFITLTSTSHVSASTEPRQFDCS